MLRSLLGTRDASRKQFASRLNSAFVARSVSRDTKVDKAIWDAISVPDPEGELQTDRKGQPLPDTDLRDNENVPLNESIDNYSKREVTPHVADAWVDADKTKIGYEIPFTRNFFSYVPPRSLSEIDSEIQQLESEIQQILARPVGP